MGEKGAGIGQEQTCYIEKELAISGDFLDSDSRSIMARQLLLLGLGEPDQFEDIDTTEEQKRWQAFDLVELKLPQKKQKKIIRFKWLNKHLKLKMISRLTAIVTLFLVAVSVPIVLPYFWMVMIAFTARTGGADSGTLWTACAILVPLTLGYAAAYQSQYGLRRALRIQKAFQIFARRRVDEAGAGRRSAA